MHAMNFKVIMVSFTHLLFTLHYNNKVVCQ